MKHTPAALSAVALACALALTACSSAPETPAPETSSAPSSSAPEKSEAPAEETESPEAPAADAGARPAWAKNPIDVGESVGTGSSDTWSVEIFRVGNAKTETDGTWAMPDTKAPVMPTGSEMTVYNFVITNTSDKTLVLDGTEAAMIKHGGVEDYKAVLGSREDGIFEGLGLSRTAYDVANLDQLPKYGDERGYPVAPGESFGATLSTWATPGDLTASVTLNVMDDAGKRLVDQTAIIDVPVTQP